MYLVGVCREEEVSLQHMTSCFLFLVPCVFALHEYAFVWLLNLLILLFVSLLLNYVRSCWPKPNQMLQQRLRLSVQKQMQSPRSWWKGECRDDNYHVMHEQLQPDPFLSWHINPSTTRGRHAVSVLALSFTNGHCFFSFFLNILFVYPPFIFISSNQLHPTTERS